MEQEPQQEKTREEIIAEAQEILRFLYGRENFEEFHKRLAAKINELRSRHSDHNDYLMYHLVIGSSEVPPDKFDFAGEDSLLEWLRREVTQP